MNNEVEAELDLMMPVFDPYAPLLAWAGEPQKTARRVTDLALELQAQLYAIQQRLAGCGSDPAALASLTAAGNQLEVELRQLLRGAEVLNQAGHSLRGWVIETRWRAETAAPGSGAVRSD